MALKRLKTEMDHLAEVMKRTGTVLDHETKTIKLTQNVTKEEEEHVLALLRLAELGYCVDRP